MGKYILPYTGGTVWWDLRHQRLAVDFFYSKAIDASIVNSAERRHSH